VSNITDKKINLHRGRGSERLERWRDCVLICTPLKQDFACFFSQNISLGATKPICFGIIFETWKFCNFCYELDILIIYVCNCSSKGELELKYCLFSSLTPSYNIV
jgi:hypothetical protein